MDSFAPSLAPTAPPYDPFNLNLTRYSPFPAQPTVHHPPKADITFCETVSYADSENVAQGIYRELVDNAKNGQLSDNALAFRCKVFKSSFGAVVVGPKGSAMGLSALGERVGEFVAATVAVSGDGDESRRLALTESAFKTGVLKINPKKPAAKRKVVAPAPRNTVSGLSTTGILALKSVTGPKHGNDVQKTRRTTSRGKTTKRTYKWKDAQNKNKKKFYEERAIEAGVSVEEYIAASNPIEGSTANSSDRTSILDDLFDEDGNLENKESTGNDSAGDEIEEDEEDQLFVKPTRSRAKVTAPMTIARAATIMANHYFDEMYDMTNSD